MKKTFAAAVAILLFVTAVKGAAITVQADDSNGFSTSSGAELGVNNLVRVGSFTISDAEIAANFTNVSFLNANFVEFGALRIGAGYGIPGHFDFTIDRGASSDSLGLVNAQVYLWVFASTNISANTDPASIADSVNSAFEHGIFYFDKGIKDSWRFRAHGDIPNTSTIDIADMTDSTGVSLLAGSNIVVGDFPKGTSSRTGARNFGLVTIPEPSSAGLLLLGSSLLIPRRKSA